MKTAIATFLAIAFVAVCAGLGIWGTDRVLALVQSEESSDGGGPGATQVTVAPIESATLRDSFNALATIRAVRSVDLRPLTEGRVERVEVESGGVVEEGDLIFALDNRAETAALEEARATLAEASAGFDRLDELAGRNVAADAQLEASRAAFLRAEAQVATAEAALADTELHAPFDGVLGLVDVDPGERIDTATVFTTLDQITVAEAAFSVPERYYARTRPGQAVLLTGDVYPDRTFEGVVTAKSPRIASASRSFDVRARIDNEDRALTPGMFMNATLVFETYEAQTLPDEAVISEGSATYVFVVDDGTAVRTNVTLGPRQGGRTVIADGLERDARVVLTGYDQLSDGAPVEVQDDGAVREALN